MSSVTRHTPVCCRCAECTQVFINSTSNHGTVCSIVESLLHYSCPEITNDVLLFQEDQGALRSINSSRMTVDPEGTLWFSNVTRFDESNDFTYACSATSAFRNEYKLGNRVYLRVLQTGSTAIQTKNEPKEQFKSRKNTVILKGRTLRLWCIYSGT